MDLRIGVWLGLSSLSILLIASHASPTNGETRCYLPPDPHRTTYIDYAYDYDDYDDGEADGYAVGTVVAMSCSSESGFITYTREAECKQNGKWSSEIDICHHPSESGNTNISCQAPTETPRGISIINNAGTYKLGKYMFVKCDLENHIFEKYEKGSLGISCVNKAATDGWEFAVPKCKRITCPTINPNDFENGELKPYQRRYHVGDSITANCFVGELRGSPTRWCTQHGTWNGTLQVCDTVLSGCGDPGKPVHGRKLDSGYEIGDTVRFECKSKTVLLGSSERTCLRDKTWSGLPTICRAPGEFLSPEEGGEAFRNAIDMTALDSSASEELAQAMRQKIRRGLLDNSRNSRGHLRFRRTPLNQFGSPGLNLYLLLDTSGSIQKRDLEIAVNLTKSIVRKLGVSSKPDGTRISIIAFKDEIWKRHLTDHTDTVTSILNFLDEITSGNTAAGGTSLQVAMDHLLDVLLPQHALINAHTSHAVILLSDGVFNTGTNPDKIVEKIKNQYGTALEFFSIGVGNIDANILKKIASTSEPEHFIYLRDYTLLDAMNRLFTGKTDFSNCGSFPGFHSLGNDSYPPEKKFWPWMTALFISDDSYVENDIQQLQEKDRLCGASILKTNSSVGSSWLLTAAHCLSNTAAKRVIALMGSTSLDEPLPLSHEAIRAKRFIIHSKFKTENLQNDIALIELERTVDFNANIRPVCLPGQNEADFYQIDTRAYVTGWAVKGKPRKTTKVLKTIYVDVTDTGECKRNLSRVLKSTEINNEWNFCAGNVPDKKNASMVQDACDNDSGGPLVIRREDTFGNKKFYQAGVVSAGPPDCGTPGQPGVYTKVAKYINWIKTHVAGADSRV